MKKLFIQTVKFIGISGIGWIIGFSIFNILNIISNKIMIHNIISSFVAICFVFAVSTQKIFFEKKGNRFIKRKFLIYAVYQLTLIMLMSRLIAIIDTWINVHIMLETLEEFTAMLAKIIVTPFTMTLNFFVMKFLIEGKGQ